ncbi:MAG: histidine phosphatase family protein [Candidatus Aenigmatarchaeota archaeon]
MRLILVRHGETVGNVKSIAQGHVQGSLTKKGVKQAKLLAEELKKYKIDVIYSSDLQRATNTAKIVSKYHKNVKINHTKILRERSMGIFENKHMKFVLAHRENSKLPRHLWRPPKGESYEDIQKRVIKFLEKIKKKHANDTVLFVAHGMVNRIIIRTLMKKSLRNAHKTEQENTCINILESTKNGKFKIKIINYTDHLKNL